MWISDNPLPAKVSRIEKQILQYEGYLYPLKGTEPNRSAILGVVNKMVKGKFKQFRELPAKQGLFKTIESFAIGRKFEDTHTLARVLAGNEPTMRLGYVVFPGAAYNGDTFILARILDCFITYKEYKDPRYIVYLDLMTSKHAGKCLKYSMTRKVFRKLTSHVGLKGKYEDKRVHHREVVGSYIFIRPSMKDDWVYIADWATTSTLKGRNKKLFKRRRNPSKEECEFHLFHNECYLCPMGSSKRYLNQCPLSTHQLHYTKELCRRCNTVGLVDKEGRTGYCLDCQKIIWSG